jgi:hypothetical protein
VASNKGSNRRVREAPLYSTPERVMVVDESLHKRLGTDLRNRGRPACGIYELQLKGTLDPDLLPRLHALYDNFVLVTGDDNMPDEHAEAIAAHPGTTIATVRPGNPHDPRQDAYEREIVHRWAHVIHEQEAGTIRRYSLRTHALWTTKKK